MDTSIFIRLLYLIAGVIFGIYLPLVVIYFVKFCRRTPFGFGLVWRFLLRLVLAGFVFLLVSFIIVLLPDLGTARGTEMVGFLGFGGMLGFVGGVVLFFVGIFKGRRKKATLSP